MSRWSDLHYKAHDTPEAKKVRIPQQEEWIDGAPPLGANGVRVTRGVVRSYDVDAGVDEIESYVSENGVFSAAPLSRARDTAP